MSNITTPTLDNEAIQAKITESANKGALKAIEEYFTGYNSPFVAAFTEELKNTKMNRSFSVPDIVSVVNKAISDEIDKLTAVAISKTFIPQLNNVLVREEKQIKFSDILKKFIYIYSADERHEFSLDIEKHREYDWLTVKIASSSNQYKFILHTDWKSQQQGLVRYTILSLPNDSYSSKMVKINVGQASVEIPFTTNILNDQFYSYIARLILSESIIDLDCQEFEDDMFESNCQCH